MPRRGQLWKLQEDERNEEVRPDGETCGGGSSSSRGGQRGGHMCASLRDHSCLTRLLTLKRPTIPRTGKDVKQTELSDFADGNI